MDNIEESFGGHLIDTSNATSKLKTGKCWLLTCYDTGLENTFLNLKIEKILYDCPSMDNFVLQIEKDEQERLHSHIAIQLKESLSSPINYFIDNIPGVIIRYIRDIKSAREYCSKKYSRVKNALVFYKIEKKEKQRLIVLGRKYKPEDMLKLIELKKLGISEVDEEVEQYIEKINKQRETKIRLMVYKIHDMSKVLLNLIKEGEDDNDKLLVEKLDILLKEFVDKKCDQRVNELKEHARKVLNKPIQTS